MLYTCEAPPPIGGRAARLAVLFLPPAATAAATAATAAAAAAAAAVTPRVGAGARAPSQSASAIGAPKVFPQKYAQASCAADSDAMPAASTPSCSPIASSCSMSWAPSTFFLVPVLQPARRPAHQTAPFDGDRTGSVAWRCRQTPRGGAGQAGGANLGKSGAGSQSDKLLERQRCRCPPAAGALGGAVRRGAGRAGCLLGLLLLAAPPPRLLRWPTTDRTFFGIACQVEFCAGCGRSRARVGVGWPGLVTGFAASTRRKNGL
eukprot:SAG22_NODE_272_length_13192_cov_311.812495_9_plen_262_part_00